MVWYDTYVDGGADYHQVIASNFEHVKLTGTNARDDLRGFNGTDVLNGGGGADILRGAAGADMLDGGSGADTMEGGTDDDLYFADDAGDVINEAADAGYDTVRFNVSGALVQPANVEEIFFLGSGVTTLTSLVIGDGGHVVVGSGDPVMGLARVAVLAKNSAETPPVSVSAMGAYLGDVPASAAADLIVATVTKGFGETAQTGAGALTADGNVAPVYLGNFSFDDSPDPDQFTDSDVLDPDWSDAAAFAAVPFELDAMNPLI